MTTDHHNDIAFGAAASAAVINNPMGQLDAAISALSTAIAGTALAIAVTTGTAAAGQKVVPMTTAPGAFIVGQSVWIGDAGTFEIPIPVIASIQAGVSLTMTANLTGTYAAGKVVSASPSELVVARSTYADLDARLTAAFGTVATSFPGSPAAGDLCRRTDRGGALYRYDAVAWRQVSVPTMTSFWAAPSTGDRAYRSDLDKLASFDGTYWLSQSRTSVSIPYLELNTASPTVMYAAAPNRGGTLDLKIDSVDFVSEVATTNNGSNYWTGAVYKYRGALALTLVANFNTLPDTVNTVTQHVYGGGGGIGLLGTADPMLGFRLSKTGTPGAIAAGCMIYCREVLT